jgi:hypothetical protein
VNTDQLNSAHAHHVANVAFQTVDALQDHPKSTQINAVAVLYKLFMEEFGMTHNDLLVRADMIIKDADMYYRAEIRALRDYIREEIK